MIPFIKFRLLYLIISSVILIPGIFALISWGVKPSIDFIGGSLFEIKTNDGVSQKDVELLFQKSQITFLTIQKSSQQSYLVRTKEVNNDQISRFKQEASDSAFILRQETVGPTIGKELLQKTIIAAFITVLGILGYLAYSFRNIRFGLAAIIALAHDTLVLFSVFSFLGHFLQIEVDTLFVTAVLTTMSFSVHDTVVVFDRIREYTKKYPKNSLDSIINQALTETIVRSLNNSLTIIFMLLALFLLGGISIRWFVLALLVGTITGVYSSPFVATPILYELQKRKKNKFKI